MGANPNMPDYAGLVEEEHAQDPESGSTIKTFGWSGEVLCKPERLDELRKLKKSHLIFMNSLSDVFHPKVPLEYVQYMFEMMSAADWHVYKILTKRPERMMKLNQRLVWPKSLIMGVTVEHNDYCYRADLLRDCGAHFKFLSLEPLLGPLPSLKIEGLDWVVVGGESGMNARKMEEAWAVDLRDRCVSAKVPFFFKQWGGVRAKSGGNLLQGRQWLEVPPIMEKVLKQHAA